MLHGRECNVASEKRKQNCIAKSRDGNERGVRLTDFPM